MNLGVLYMAVCTGVVKCLCVRPFMLLSYTMLDAPQSFMYGSMYSCGNMLVCATFSPNSGCSGFHVWQYVQV